MNEKIHALTEAAKATPPVTVAGLTVAGLDIPQIIQIATLVYLAMQIGLLLPTYYRAFKKWLLKRESPQPEQAD